MNILEVQNIEKRYPRFLLKDISFSLESGSITGFIGQNGAGKTTTMKIIMGLAEADSGKIIYKGLPMKVDNTIGYLGSGKEIYPDIKLKDITKFIKIAYKEIWNEVNYMRYFNLFGLNEKSKMKELSTGMKIKYMITLELSKNLDMLILDEPTSGLDPIIRDEVLNILYNLATKDKLTIFFSSHITEDIEKIAKHIIYINNGQIILDEHKETISKKYIRLTENEFQNLDNIDQMKIKEIGTFNKGYYVIDKMILNSITNVNFTPASLDEILLYLKGVHND